MRNRSMRIALLASLTFVAATACKKEDETPPANQAGIVQPGYQQQGYQQTGTQQTAQPGYAQQTAQPTYAQPAAQPAYAQPAAQPATATAAAAASPTPSPLATVCKSDAECIGAKCNVSAGKCQFPCGSNADCQAGWACALQMGAVCMPAPGATK
jgi:hypothetical protein